MGHIVLPLFGKPGKVTGFGNQRNFSFKARLATCLLTSLFLLFNQKLDSHGGTEVGNVKIMNEVCLLTIVLYL